jgi:hypothetical protein
MARLSSLAWFALGYLVLLEGMLAAAILFWPQFASHVEAIRSMTKALPIMGEMLEQVEDKGVLAYILGQHFFKGCNALGTAAAVLFAAPAVAGEAHRGTLEMWLARPFSRRRILFERYLAGAVALVAPVFLSTLTIPALAARVHELEPLAPYLRCAAHESLFLLAIYGVAFLCSSVGSNPNKIALSLLFLAVFSSPSTVKKVTHLSFFRLCDMEVLMSALATALERADPDLPRAHGRAHARGFAVRLRAPLAVSHTMRARLARSAHQLALRRW